MKKTVLPLVILTAFSVSSIANADTLFSQHSDNSALSGLISKSLTQVGQEINAQVTQALSIPVNGHQAVISQIRIEQDVDVQAPDENTAATLGE